MTKDKIISEIKRITYENFGNPPGIRRFESETGIKKSLWYPKIWLKWSDALREAGVTVNKMDIAYKKEDLILFYIELIRELDAFPIDGELRRKAKEDSTFPSGSSFRRLGTKVERAREILAFSEIRDEYMDIIKYCEPIVMSAQASTAKDSNDPIKIGYVYMIRHGKRNEYKIGKTFNPIRREGEIRLELPEKVKPIHTIATDDPSGIEKYWHNRFSDKRKEGEWFGLSAIDVRAFKKWKRIH